MMEKELWTTALLALDSLSIYRGLLHDNVLGGLRALLICLDQKHLSLREAVNLYNDFFFALAKRGTFSLPNAVLDSLILDENPFSLCASTASQDKFRPLLEKAAAQDLRKLQLVSQLEPGVLKACIHEALAADKDKDNLTKDKDNLTSEIQTLDRTQIVASLPDWSCEYQAEHDLTHFKTLKEKFQAARQWETCLEDLQDFHQTYGCGMYARYTAFVWERKDGQGYVQGIERPDPITLNDLIDYQDERANVIENTLLLLKGYPANNVLLYGDRGTGKSSTVKAILNEYHHRGLRMLELPKAYLADFPLVIRHLKDKPQKFIIFIDDLVFGDSEENYTTLKAMLEGGLECKSDNLVIYATSNRRHLVKEYFRERTGLHAGNPDEEVHARDNMQEKLSLANRFGLSVVFSTPDQNRYLRIVEGIAANRHLDIDKKRLHREALQWALLYNGRSARTAKQFVDWLEGHEPLGANL